jgi:hypothetical protein
MQGSGGAVLGEVGIFGRKTLPLYALPALHFCAEAFQQNVRQIHLESCIHIVIVDSGIMGAIGQRELANHLQP